MKVAVIIPARYASSRFPGKPLAQLCGKPMIQHVYEKAAASAADLVAVATDDERIAAAVEAFGGVAVMTAKSHPSGTDRIAEAAERLGAAADIIINVQGDEPLIPATVIDELIDVMKRDPALEMATVAVPADRALLNENNVRVVFGRNHRALYFSRAAIPFVRGDGGEDAGTFLHWGIYAYRRDTLAKMVALPPSPLERCEKLEQLRALENNIGIYVHISNLESIGVDTPEDLIRVEARLRREK